MRGLMLSGFFLLFSACSEPGVKIDDATETPAAVPTQNSEYDLVVDPAAGDTLNTELLRPPADGGETRQYPAGTPRP